MSKSRRFLGFLVYALVLSGTVTASFSVYADGLTLAAAPRESAEKGKELYDPVAAYLSKVLGKPVTYVHTNHWIRYQSDMKKRKYDFVFDGPHLASWRIKNIEHTPVVKLPGNLQFHFLALADDNNVNKPEDLIYKRVCVIPPPNLTAVTLLQKLNDPVREPVLISVKGSMKNLYEKLIQGECSGAVVRTDFYQGQLSAEEKDLVKIVYTSEQLPNQALTASNRVSDAEIEKLVLALTSVQGQKVLAPLLKRFGGKEAVSFIPAERQEYVGYSKFLEGVVLGW
ncbi:MAG TPA: PhnD/SsuA/transferrin family substrate-binding protein [Gammaproteobacteria bacterium]